MGNLIFFKCVAFEKQLRVVPGFQLEVSEVCDKTLHEGFGCMGAGISDGIALQSPLFCAHEEARNDG